MLFLSHWARKLSWQERCRFATAGTRGARAPALGSIVAIDVDEIQYGKGRNYLTLVYRIPPAVHPPCYGSAKSGPFKGGEHPINRGPVNRTTHGEDEGHGAVLPRNKAGSGKA